MTAQNFKIAPLSPLYKFSPPLSPLFKFSPPSLLKSPPGGRFAPVWETLLYNNKTKNHRPPLHFPLQSSCIFSYPCIFSGTPVALEDTIMGSGVLWNWVIIPKFITLPIVIMYSYVCTPPIGWFAASQKPRWDEGKKSAFGRLSGVGWTFEEKLKLKIVFY